MAKAKEPKNTSSASTKAAKPAAARSTTASRPATASHRPAKTAPDAPSSDVIQTGARSSGGSRGDLSPEEIYRLIQETAYYKAKARGFEPGHEVQDWIEAEAEVRMRLDSRA
jgi:hypothetical protein